MGSQIQKYLQLARQQCQQNNFPEALKTLGLALKEDPNHPFTHAFLALVHYDIFQQSMDKQSIKEGILSGKQAIALDPNSVLAHYALGLLYLAKDHFSLRRAKSHLLEAKRLDPQDPSVLNALIGVYIKTRKKKQVLRGFTETLKLDPENENILARYGHYLFHLGQIKDAEQKAREVLKIAPQNSQAHLLMGKILFFRGQVEEAKEHASLALNDDPNDFRTLYLICAMDSYKNPILRGIFHLEIWLAERWYRTYLFYGSFWVLLLLTTGFLPKKIGSLYSFGAYAIVFLIMAYIRIIRDLTASKVKKKYLKPLTLAKNF